MAAGIGQQLLLHQAHFTLSLGPAWCPVLLIILDDVLACSFLVEQIGQIHLIEIGEGVEHECPSLAHAALLVLLLDVLPDFTGELF